MKWFICECRTLSYSPLHTHHLILLSLYLGWGWVGRWKAPFGPKSFEVHPTNSQCVPLSMMGFEYVNGLPPIHEGPLRPLVGIMAHLVVSDVLIYPFSLRKAYPHLESIYFPLRMFCMQYKNVFFQQLVSKLSSISNLYNMFCEFWD